MSAVAKDVARWPRYGARLDRWRCFEAWIEVRYTPTTWQDVVAEFGCSRATAYRWITYWKALQWARGVEA